MAVGGIRVAVAVGGTGGVVWVATGFAGVWVASAFVGAIWGVGVRAIAAGMMSTVGTRAMAASLGLSWEAAAHRITPAVKAEKTPPRRNSTANRFSLVSLNYATSQTDQLNRLELEASDEIIVLDGTPVVDIQRCCLSPIEVPEGRGMIL